MTYTPFERPLSLITGADLKALTAVAEGWYVEYKRELPSVASIAKSISAFANTDGGWLFYGIDELSKAEPVAGTFVGIPADQADASVQKIRSSVLSVMPAPHFEVRCIVGPVPELSLPKERAVVIVWVPRGVNTPHVHKDGRIYRRHGDSSEPLSDNDRYSLDALWQRGKELSKTYKRWIDRDPELSKGEGDVPFLRLLILPELYGDRGYQLNVSQKEIYDIFNERKDGDPQFSIPYSQVYTSSNGYVARQISSNHFPGASLTWQIYDDGVCEVLLPLNCWRAQRIWQIRDALSGYDHIEDFISAMQGWGAEEINIVDLNHCYLILSCIMHTYSRIAEKIGHDGSWHIKLKLLNGWRLTPFIDEASVVASFSEYGLPVTQRRESTSPPGTDITSFAEIKLSTEASEEWRYMGAGLSVFKYVAEMFGVAINFSNEEKVVQQITDMFMAGQRFIAVQDRRTKSRDD